MSVIVKHSEEVVCDLCNKPIRKIVHFGFLGTRFSMVKGIFGKPIHAYICDECQLILIRATEKKGSDDSRNGEVNDER